MRRSSERILTTHVGSLPQLADLLTMIQAKEAGRQVVAGADCGFASFSTSCEVHPTEVWAKLAALAEGARLASRELWAGV